MRDDIAYVKIHQFKTHLSGYIRALEQGQIRGVVVQRGTEPVGFFIPYKSTNKSPPNGG